ncbi:MAG: prepilin-type N-terminal cleavage/methylation domain-containing protein [Deferribacterales bacterium]
MKKGFTLLEVLIAMAVLSISMLGIYRLSAMSVEMSDYAKEKTLVTEAGYQRVLEVLNYPGKVFKDKGRNVMGISVNYTSDTESTIFPGVNEITLTTEHEGVSTVYVYYEQQ